MRFYVGADAGWIGKANYPLMVSHGRLRTRKSFRAALDEVIIDSRGFTELQQNGGWTFDEYEYVGHLVRYNRGVGKIQWASPMDWMCEPAVIHGGTYKGVKFAGTGLSVVEHLRRTVANGKKLAMISAETEDCPKIIKSLQGDTIDDYLLCWKMYEDAGIDLLAEPVVGLGSTCRRESTHEVREIVEELTGRGLRLHGYGTSIGGVKMYGHLLTSADSFSWSYGARRRGGMCPHGTVKWERNCPEWAGAWRGQILAGLAA